MCGISAHEGCVGAEKQNIVQEVDAHENRNVTGYPRAVRIRDENCGNKYAESEEVIKPGSAAVAEKLDRREALKRPNVLFHPQPELTSRRLNNLGKVNLIRRALKWSSNRISLLIGTKVPAGCTIEESLVTLKWVFRHNCSFSA